MPRSTAHALRPGVGKGDGGGEGLGAEDDLSTREASLTSRAPVTRPAGPALVRPGRSFGPLETVTRPSLGRLTAPHRG